MVLSLTLLTGCVDDQCGQQSFHVLLNGEPWDAAMAGCKFLRGSNSEFIAEATERRDTKTDPGDLLIFDGIPLQKGRVYLNDSRPGVFFFVHEETDAPIDVYEPLSDSTSYIDIESINFRRNLVEATFHALLVEPGAENRKYPDTVVFSDGTMQFRVHKR